MIKYSTSVLLNKPKEIYFTLSNVYIVKFFKCAVCPVVQEKGKFPVFISDHGPWIESLLSKSYPAWL